VNNLTKIAVWLGLFLLVLVLFNLFGGQGMSPQAPDVSYSEFVKQVKGGTVKDAEIDHEKGLIRGTRPNGDVFTTRMVLDDPSLVPTLLANNVNLQAKKHQNGSTILLLVGQALPVLLIIAFLFLIMRQMQGGGGRAMGFGKSRAKLLTEKTGRVTFEDVAGVDEAKEELQEIVDFLRDPQKFQRLGGRIPKGALLVGPPGTGKTLLARAIAGEAGVPFYTISGSDFVEMFVGVGASRVRDMFIDAKKNAPCIVFIDEIDAVGRHRGAGLGGGNDEREQTLNQLLVEMDGFESNEGVIIIAATNRPDVLDPALLRPGRFDRQVVVGLPDVVGREKILKVHMRKIPIAPDVSPRVIARGTPGFSGADLANLVNEAALLAARRNKRLVTMRELEDSKDKVMMGAERRSLVMTEEEKKLTAYHEGGHAIVGLNMEGYDPLHKVTIIPRGRALGVTMSLPERDRYSHSKRWLEQRLAVLFGGRCAEEIIFGAANVTTGASDDIRQATNLARRMVTEWGMSEKLGPLRYSGDEEEVFLGHSVTQRKNVSDATARLIDEETRQLVDAGEATARRVLTEKAEELRILAEGLLEYETLSGDEVRALLRGEAPDRSEKTEDSPRPQTSSVPTTRKPKPKGGAAVGPEPEPQGA
jgi:cell division protease FtsH